MLLAESEVDLKEKLNNWKATMEANGMKVNLAKAEVIWMGSGKDHREVGKFPCAVCGRGVGSISPFCVEDITNGHTSAAAGLKGAC